MIDTHDGFSQVLITVTLWPYNPVYTNVCFSYCFITVSLLK